METQPQSGRAVETPPTLRAEGLRGVQVSDSSISFVDGANGRLLYRGYDIKDLADQSTFEETVYLLLFGELPTRVQLRDFSRQLATERRLPSPVLRWIKKVPRDANPMDALRTGVSMLGAFDPDANDASPEARGRVTMRLIARVATLVGHLGRIHTGHPIILPHRGGSHAENFFRMLTGNAPDEFQARAMDVALILHADHEFNASTFAARVTASTLSDPYSAVTSAISALKGPLHGGANLAVMRQLETIGNPGRAEAWVREQLSQHQKVMGFGHAVYKTMDPRAAILKQLSADAGRRYGDPKWYEISAKLQDLMQRDKGMWPNVDFYSASLYRVLGIAPALFPPIFAVSRISGWTAHVREQLADNKLIRPLSNYVGPPLRPFVTLRKRK